MNLWTPKHKALLEALEAQRILPHLVCRLSLERSWLSAEQALKLRRWSSSMRSDAAWAVLEPALEQPTRWPTAWAEAKALGFSPETDHHLALYFTQLCWSSVHDCDFDRALYAWEEMFAAWQRASTTTYLEELVEDLTAGLGEEVKDASRQVLATLLDPPIARVAQYIRQALAIEDVQGKPLEPSDFDRAMVRFAWSCLEFTGSLDVTDPIAGRATHPMIIHAATAARRERRATIERILNVFGRQVDDLDPTRPGIDALLKPFEGVAAIFTVLPIDLTVATDVVTRALDLIWKLRSLEHGDEKEAMARILAISRPFHDVLLDSLTKSDDAFGHHSQAADFLVFLGERAMAVTERVAYFEHALNICPGHRNASMMVSHAYLERANVHLLKTSAIPDIAGQRGPAAAHVQKIVESARDLVLEAQRLYPHNEKLAGYRDDALKECRRFGLDPLGLVTQDTQAEHSAEDDDV